MTTRVPEAFTFIEEDPELGNLPASSAWAALVARLEKLGEDDVLVRCSLGHSWQAQRVAAEGETSGLKPALCPFPSCQLAMPVLVMQRRSIGTIRRMAALPEGHRLARCTAGHEWDADAELFASWRVEDGRPKCPECDGAAEVCFVASPLVLAQVAADEAARAADGEPK